MVYIQDTKEEHSCISTKLPILLKTSFLGQGSTNIWLHRLFLGYNVKVKTEYKAGRDYVMTKLCERLLHSIQSNHLCQVINFPQVYMSTTTL